MMEVYSPHVSSVTFNCLGPQNNYYASSCSLTKSRNMQNRLIFSKSWHFVQY